MEKSLPSAARKKSQSSNVVPLVDGALDTLGCVFTTLARESFPIDADHDASDFQDHCQQLARHIENGAAAPDLDIELTERGSRAWGQVRRFYIDRRKQENAFVTERFQDYRGIVEDLVNGLRHVNSQSTQTEARVKHNLDSIEAAVIDGKLPEIRRVLAATLTEIDQAFLEQKQDYENELQSLNERMASLREDLVSAQEEMKVDALTDVYNRGAFDTALNHAINMNFVLNQEVSLVMIDIDNFKRINDSFGHATGDNALRAFGALLSRAFVRKNDLIARYGGDEFAVLLPDTPADKATVSINRFLTSVPNIKVDGLPKDFAISCSAGCTQIIDSDTAESLLVRADKALYDAKRAGRNCLSVRY